MAATRQQAFDEARRLVTVEGYSYAEAAEATGIPLSTIQKRASAEGWQKQAETAMSYGAQIKAMKAALLARIVTLTESGSADWNAVTQLIHAWRGMETAFPEHRYNAQEADPKARLGLILELLEHLVSYFEKADRNLLTALQPHLKPFAEHLEGIYAS